jgi:hypothetical protein
MSTYEQCYYTILRDWPRLWAQLLAARISVFLGNIRIRSRKDAAFASVYGASERYTASQEGTSYHLEESSALTAYQLLVA